MPPKPKKTPATPKEPPSNAGITLTKEQEQQFELELCWCIQQLQAALKSGKLTDKQVRDHTKALNCLMSNSSSIVKKRQTMRLSFGDYRIKMAAEEQKATRNVNKIKIQPAKPSKKSLFVKKSTFASSFGGNNFQFDFKMSEEQEDCKNMASASENDIMINKKTFSKVQMKSYVPSNNSFRFNFDVKT